MANNFSHAIFDLDGLLIDTESIYTECNEELCAKFNKQFTWEIKSKQMGRRPDEAAQILIDELQLPITIPEHHKLLNAMLVERFPDCKIMPGAAELVRKLKEHGIPMCIATGSDNAGLELKLQRKAELRSNFHHIVCCGSDPEVEHGKPQPDGFLVAARRFPQPPSDYKNILVFEDAVNGVQGALAAGMRVVWCPDPRANTDEYKNNPDVTIVKSLLDFQPF